MYLPHVPLECYRNPGHFLRLFLRGFEFLFAGKILGTRMIRAPKPGPITTTASTTTTPAIKATTTKMTVITTAITELVTSIILHNMLSVRT